MRRQIAVGEKDREFLKKLFDVTDRTIRNALDLGKPESDVRKRIRKAAIERGGEVVVTLREMETIHTADGVMEQRLGNGALLKFFREDGHGEIWMRGKLVGKRDYPVTIPEIFEMQVEAALLR